MPARVLAVLLLTMIGTACGSGAAHGTKSSVLGRAFQRRAVAVCEAALAQKKAQGPFPYPSFNLTKPDPSTLPGIAKFEGKTVKIYETWLHKMLALGQSTTGRAPWTDVVNALKRHVRIIVEQRAAAGRGDGPTFTKDYDEGNKAQEDLSRAADAAGVPVCAAAAAA